MALIHLTSILHNTFQSPNVKSRKVSFHLNYLLWSGDYLMKCRQNVNLFFSYNWKKWNGKRDTLPQRITVLVKMSLKIEFSRFGYWNRDHLNHNKCMIVVIKITPGIRETVKQRVFFGWIRSGSFKTKRVYCYKSLFRMILTHHERG